MQKIILYIFFFISAISFSQETKIDVVKLNTKVSNLINNHRKTLKVKTLEKDEYLKKAAEDQSCYIAKNKSLSHEQTTINKENPKKRVYFYQGNEFIMIGENLLYTSIIDKTYSDSALDILATKIFNLWKNSPNHLKNINNSKYSFAELGFCLDWEDKRIYVAQVFGVK
jgi:uncharacterized protein YkwD